MKAAKAIPANDQVAIGDLREVRERINEVNRQIKEITCPRR